MSKIRLAILTKILEEEQIRKLAQETEVVGDNIDQATADKLADDIFDKLFNQTLDEAGLDKLLS